MHLKYPTRLIAAAFALAGVLGGAALSLNAQYEAHRTRNIVLVHSAWADGAGWKVHPEMAAVVVTLNTPYWGVSSDSGVVTMHNVPPGNYRMHVWSEAASSVNPVVTEGTIQVGTAAVRLHEIVLEGASDPMAHHKNKFGDDYRPDHNRSY
jgi:hypothetical protein